VLTLIMAGGVGERFWPWSRRTRPKQLLDLTGRGSMIGLTVDRLDGLSTPEEILIVTNVDQREAILQEVSGKVPSENVIGEPIGRNTAPCIGLAALWLRERHGDRPMLVLPADHLIEPVADFQAQARSAADFVADREVLLTFGIKPSRPETGYGYIQTGELVLDDGDARIYRATAFLEKPDAETAREFLDSGSHFWNSGMFMWRTGVILDEITTHLPDLGEILERIGLEMGTRPLPEVLKRQYPQTPSVSIDYGVMEKATDVVVMAAGFEWNDVGSWEFMREIHTADRHGNVSLAESVTIDASGNTIVAPDRLVAMLGVEDVVVVDGGDAILVCKRDRVQEIKKIVQNLRERDRFDVV
jgi:mannose-1-phosphate guanylyltransferase